DLAIRLDQIDRAAQLETAFEHHVFADARRVANARHPAEGELKLRRLPFGAVAREVLQPCDQIAADGRDLVNPDPLHCGRQLVVLARVNGSMRWSDSDCASGSSR